METCKSSTGRELVALHVVFAMRLIMVCLLALSHGLAEEPKTVNGVEQATSGQNGLMTPQELQALPSKPADHRYFYGKDANQFGDLRVPSGSGPYPVVILIHGGCWKAEFGTLRDLAPMGDVLKSEGIATWNIEYRRLPQAGSGWPGTFLDIGQGVDFLRSIAASNKLDIERTIVVGHSAGGTLALWAAARPHLPRSSPLYVVNPLPLRGVIDLAGTGDYEAFIPNQQHACGETVVDELLKGKPHDIPDRYAEVSAMKMLPLGLPQVILWGQLDQVIPVSMGELYVQEAKKSGDSAWMVTFPDLAHFEIASPFSKSWLSLNAEILKLLQKGNYVAEALCTRPGLLNLMDSMEVWCSRQPVSAEALDASQLTRTGQRTD